MTRPTCTSSLSVSCHALPVSLCLFPKKSLLRAEFGNVDHPDGPE
jgi:hypothetical protein